MLYLLDYILDLFGNENNAQAFVADPQRALADAGLVGVAPERLQSVATVAVPSLAIASSGDPVSDLQQAVSSHYGFDRHLLHGHAPA